MFFFLFGKMSAPEKFVQACTVRAKNTWKLNNETASEKLDINSVILPMDKKLLLLSKAKDPLMLCFHQKSVYTAVYKENFLNH